MENPKLIKYALFPWNWMCTGVLFLQIVCGVQFGWTINLTNEDFTPIVATEKQICFVQLSLFVGVAFGAIICMRFMPGLGHYCTQITASLLMIVTSGLGFFTYQYGIKAILSQFFGGIAYSFVSTSYIIITSEISSPKKRGLFICQGPIASFFGVLLYVFNLKFMDRFINLNGLMLSLSLCSYLLIYMFHMESPVLLISEGKVKNAHYLLKQMSSDCDIATKDLLEQQLVEDKVAPPPRGNDSYENLQVLIELQAESSIVKYNVWKLCSLTVVLKLLTLLANAYIIQTLMLGLVSQNNEPLVLQIFITLAQSPLLGLVFSVFWIDKLSRRLLLLSCSGGIAGLLTLAGILNMWCDSFDDINWLYAIVLGMSVAQFLNGFGILGVSQTILSEIFPLRSKCYYLASALIFETVVFTFLYFAAFNSTIEFLTVPWNDLDQNDCLSVIVTSGLGFSILLLGIGLYRFLPETSGLNLKQCLDKFRRC